MNLRAIIKKPLFLFAVAEILMFSIIAAIDYFAPTFLEVRSVFVYSSDYAAKTILKVGGLGNYLGAFLVQFFKFPFLGVLLCSSVLAGITVLSSSFLAGVGLAFLLFCPDNYMGYLVAFLVCAALLKVSVKKHAALFDCLCCAVLFWGFGSIATLYVALLFLEKRPKEAFGALGVLCASIIIALWTGACGTLARAALPSSYVPLITNVPITVFLPWIFIVVERVLVRFVKKESLMMAGDAVAALCAGVGLYFFSTTVNPSFYKKILYYEGVGKWEKIEKAGIRKPYQMAVPINHNIFNYALAKQGTLLDKLFVFPIPAEDHLISKPDFTQYVQLVMCDVYYDCGIVATAQRFAFEANEISEGYCPKALKRLVQTNIIFDSPLLARKYIDILKHTLFYRGWAKSCEAFLDGEVSIPSIERMLPCKDITEGMSMVYETFPGELQRSIEAQGKNMIAIQYYFSDLLLQKELGQFRTSLESFWDKGILPPTLPLQLQMTIVSYAMFDTEILKKYNVSDRVVSMLEPFQRNPERFKYSIWYYLSQNAD